MNDRVDTERHATNLELFLDLVFVFAVTQVAEVLGDGERVTGIGRGVLLAWLVWWLWSQFTWLGTAIDLSSQSVSQLLVLAAVPLALLVAVAIPGAFDESAIWFAGAYLAANLWSLAIQGRGLWAREASRRAWLQYAPVAIIAPCVLFFGAFFSRGPRTAIWTVVAMLNVVSALLASRRGAAPQNEWTIDPLHFAERHSLFVIISLGEVLVAIGVAAAQDKLGPETVIGGFGAVAMACVLWWSYFAYVPSVIEARLRAAQGHDRAGIARNLFTFGHFPIILGVVLYSVAAKHMMRAPYDHLRAFDLAIMAISVASFVGGILWLQWQNARWLARERVAVIVATGLWCGLVGRSIPGVAVIGAVAVALSITQVILVRRFAGGSANSELPGRSGD